MAGELDICLVCPYALAAGHPVAEHVRAVSRELAGRGHRVTVLAPSASSEALRSGRRRLRELAEGNGDVLRALPGEPLAVAVGPAIPHGSRGRHSGAGLPVATSANVALAVGSTRFDIVHVHEPLLPGVSPAALKHSRGLTVATFHAEFERAINYPLRGGKRKRLGGRIDALIATSQAAARRAAEVYPGEYRVIPAAIDPSFVPGSKREPELVVCEWSTESRGVVRALVRLAASRPQMRLTLLRDRRGRRPLRPYVPVDARGRVHTVSTSSVAERAELLGRAAVAVSLAGGDSSTAWEARACGCAVVSPDGMAGLPFAVDQPALAAAATARLLDDPDLLGRLSAESLAAAGERSPERVGGELEELYQGLLSRRRAAERRSRPADRSLIDVDLHMHTSHSHDCATEPEALVDHCIAQGLGAIAITDHNEISGALEAAALGKPITIIVGEEVKTSQGEVIGLFLTERIPPRLSMAETIDEIQRQGGLVLMPHPFDRMHTIPDTATLLRELDRIDIFEVYNSRLLFESFNDDALRFATKYNLVQSAGSDAHVLQGIGTAINRIPAFDGPEEFLLAMRQNEILRRPKSLLYLQGLKWMHQVSRTG